MAAKKSTSKAASKTGKAKTAAKKAAKSVVKKPVKQADPNKKVVKKAAKKAPAKKQAVTKKVASAPAKKTTKAAVKPAAAPQEKVAVKISKSKSKHSSSFITKQHQRLLDLHDELVEAMSGMTRDTIRNAPEGSEASGSGQHQGDAGSDAYDRDFALSVLAKEQDALYEIEQALRRVEIGTYGICEMSFEKIPNARLEAIPFARLTVECQSKWEKEYGNRRFRPSDEVGFSGGHQFDDEDSESVSLDEDDE